ncbi:MAG: hypothetical protein ACLFRX_09205, partial [Gemmatimonadota bacterium]
MSGGGPRITGALVAALLAGPVQAAAQAGASEIRLLEAAAEREAAGELAGAEALLREILEERRASVPALLALERNLRIQGRLDELPSLIAPALEDEPGSALLNQLLVRTLSALDRPAALADAAEAWIEARPGLEIPYREVAEAWAGRGEYGRARAILEEGRRRLRRQGALALELGTLYATLEQAEPAAREWALAVEDGRGTRQVQRRLRSLPDGGASIVPGLVDRLADDHGIGRREAALELAAEAGLEDRVRTLTTGLLADWSSGDRRRRFEALARAADRAGHTRLALWAYEQRLAREPDGTGPGLMALRHRYAQLALAAGDTAAVGAAHGRVDKADEPGSRDAEEAAAVAAALLATGRVAEAESLVAGRAGPRAALV